jgi:hypothetical protein
MFFNSSVRKTNDMKTLATIAVITLSAISFDAVSQAGDKKEKELDKLQESERSRSTQGLRTENEFKDDRQEVESNQYRKSNADSVREDQTNEKDEVIEPNKDQGLGTDDDGNGLTNENNTTQDGEQRTNTPAVIQRTSSESGSPAVLSGNNGKERDGTNNVQRATPNIAGAKEPGNMNLSKKDGAPKNQNTGSEHKIRKQEEQPAQIRDSKKTDKAEVMPPQKQDQESGELKENTAQEQEATTVTTAKEDRKAKRKNRRNRRKD